MFRPTPVESSMKRQTRNGQAVSGSLRLASKALMQP